MLRIGAFAGSVLVGLAFLVLAQEPQPKGVKEAKNPDASARAAAVRKALAERLEVPDEFRKPTERVPFRIVLAHIAGVLAERKQSLDIAIDSAAFKEAAEGDAIDILESDISFPPFVPTATVQDLLAAALKQIPTNNATYLIRNGRVDILTHEGANIRLLLDQGVAVQFRELPLKLAIERKTTFLRGGSCRRGPTCSSSSCWSTSTASCSCRGRSISRTCASRSRKRNCSSKLKRRRSSTILCRSRRSGFAAEGNRSFRRERSRQ
jgi:hypothetical protein